MSNKRWRCIWIKNNAIWGSKNVCYYCGQQADSVDHVVPQDVLRMLAALSDIAITRAVLRKRALRVWACRECNSLASCSIQDSLQGRRQFVKDKLKKKYRKILELPKWEPEELEDMGYVLRKYIEHAADIKALIEQRINW